VQSDIVLDAAGGTEAAELGARWETLLANSPRRPPGSGVSSFECWRRAGVGVAMAIRSAGVLGDADGVVRGASDLLAAVAS
jgi:hypothetical protein